MTAVEGPALLPTRSRFHARCVGAAAFWPRHLTTLSVGRSPLPLSVPTFGSRRGDGGMPRPSSPGAGAVVIGGFVLAITRSLRTSPVTGGNLSATEGSPPVFLTRTPP